MELNKQYLKVIFLRNGKYPHLTQDLRQRCGLSVDPVIVCQSKRIVNF